MVARTWITRFQLFSELWALKKRGSILGFRWVTSEYDLGYVRKATIATLSIGSERLCVVIEDQGLTGVTATPHYTFVVGHLSGRDEMKKPWRRYVATFYGSALLPSKEKEFTTLIETAKTGAKLPRILVRKSHQQGSFVVLDGLHRFAIQSVLSPTEAIDCYLTP